MGNFTDRVLLLISCAITLFIIYIGTARANAHYHHMIIKTIVKPSDPVGASGGAWCTGGCVWVGGFIATIAGAIIVHELMGPACAKPGNKNGYDTPTFWRPLCKTQPISVRG